MPNHQLFLLCFLLAVSHLGCGSPSEPAQVPHVQSDNQPNRSAAPVEATSTQQNLANSLASSDENLPVGVQVDLELVDWQGFQEAIARKRGRVVVVDIWSTSCDPCLKEFRHLVDLSSREGIACISLNVDYVGLKKRPPSSYRDKVYQFLRQQQAVKVHNLLSTVTDQEVYEHFQIDSIPAVVIYDSQGQLVQCLSDSTVGGNQGVSYTLHVVPLIDSL